MVRFFFIVSFSNSFPANICWSWRRLQHVFSAPIFRLPRRLEDVLQIRLEDISQDVLKTSWRRLGRQKIVTLKTSWRRLEDILKTCLEDVLKTCLQDVLKTSWRHVLKMSWRRLGNKQIVYWGYVFNPVLPENLNQYLTNLYLINLYFTNLRRIQNALIRTQ